MRAPLKLHYGVIVPTFSLNPVTECLFSAALSPFNNNCPINALKQNWFLKFRLCYHTEALSAGPQQQKLLKEIFIG